MRHTVHLAAAATQWRVNRKGCFIILNADGEPLGPLGRKARAIIAYLASHLGEHVGRDRLIELLWADRGDEQARGSLRQSLFEIRRIAPDLIEANYQHVWIDAAHLSWDDDSTVSPDLDLFADLNGITNEFDEWLRSRRAAETSEEWSDLRRRAESLINDGEGAAASPVIERMQQLDPFNEDWLRLAMRAEAQAGHPAGIQRRFAEFAELLRTELNVAPALETRELRDRLLHELTADRQVESPAIHEAGAVAEETDRRAPTRRNPWLMLAGGTAMLASLGLTQSATSAPVPTPTVAVLPFEAVGVEPALADGFSDELLTQLVQNRGLRVIGRTAFEDVRSTPEGLTTFRRDLGVEYLVEGRVARDDRRVRVLVSLVRTKDAKTIWAQNFVGSTGRLQAMQAAIGSAVGRSLSTSAPPPFARKTINGEAYNLYLRAKGLIRDRSQEGFRSAAVLLDQAIKADPNFAAAWALLAANTRLAEESPTFPDPTKPDNLLTPVQGAQKALNLNPHLAEAHAIMALAARLDTPRGRAHIKKALELDSTDPQTLFWAGITAGSTGNFKLANDLCRRAASLDPLAKRPVICAGTAALSTDSPAAAEHYLRTMKAGNPKAAIEVEVAYKFAEGDFSTAAAIATKDWAWNGSWDASKNMAKLALLGIGIQQTPFGPHTPIGRSLSFGKMADRNWLLKQSTEWSAEGTDEVFCMLVCWALAREGRWSDLAAIYESGDGVMGLLANGDPGGRLARISFGGITALALKKAGRDREAVKVALATNDAIKVALANGEVPPDLLASIAQDEAVLGQPEAALAHLEEAYSKGWRMFLYTNRYMDPSDDPTFATLRGNPRFERINRLVRAHKAKERKEYLAFMNQSSWRDGT